LSASVGYSGKAVWQKLGLAPNKHVLAIGAPRDYASLTGAEPDCLTAPEPDKPPDIVHLFVHQTTALAALLDHWLPQLAVGGMCWVSWPKKTSPLFQELRAGSPNGAEAGSRERLTEGAVRAAAIARGWVDVKVCAIDADWSGLKLLRRRR
jgi:hypothetical protein